jgi:hypothetical protein
MEEITLTPERIFEAAPIPSYRRRELEWLRDNCPNSDTEYRRTYESWEYLLTWYTFEAKAIGKMRAFRGVVYRLLDDPTERDVEVIRDWLEHDYKTFWGYPDNPVEELLQERVEKRAEFVLTMYEPPV